MSKSSLLYQNDKPGQYPQSWYAASVQPLDMQPSLAEPTQCDVCIIGGGFTGLSAAITLAERGIDVVLLDAHRVGWGASGRNGGQLGTGQRVEQDELEQRYGVDAAKALWQLAQASKECVHNYIARYHIDCDYCPGIIHADHKRSYARHSQAYVEKLNQQYQYQEIRYLDQQQLRDRLDSDEYFSGSVDTGSGHLHPLKLALGMARAAIHTGVRVYETTEVFDYKSTEAGVKIRTARGEVACRQMLLACNGYLGKLSQPVAARVMPINNYIIATEPLPDELAGSLIRDNMAVADSKFVVNYFRMSADQRMLFGGRESYGYRFPDDIKSFVQSAMLKVFPQLSAVSIDYGWGGTLAITMNRMPHLQQIERNVISSSGYSGHGVGMATLSGALCAEAITGKLDRFDVMASVPHSRFPGGASLRSPLLKLGMLYYSLRDHL